MRRRSSMCGGATSYDQVAATAAGRALARCRPRLRNGRPNSIAARPIVVACKAGHEMSQTAVAQLRADGFDARVLEGGYEAWAQAGLPFVAKAELDRFAPKRPSLWVTRRRPKIDRIACPWLIRRFLDPQARILFVDPDQVVNVANESGGNAVRHRKDVEISPRRRALQLRHHAQAVRAGRRAVAGAAGADRARRRHRAARSSRRRRPACTRSRSACRRWPATTIMACSNAASWSTMRCSPGCALPPRSGTTGRRRRRDDACATLNRRRIRASARPSRSG